MMKTNRYFRSVSHVVVLLTLLLGATSCQGEQGPAGEDGYVNASTYEVNLDLSSFQKLATNSSYEQSFVLNTTPILATDVVLMYMYNETIDNTDYWAQLPFDYWYDNYNYVHYSFQYGLNNVVFLNMRNSNGLAPYTPMTGKVYLKVVVIKGSIYRAATVPANLNVKSYDAVKQYYHLRDTK